MRNSNVKMLAGTALLAALVVVLQTFASGIKIGIVNITLSLIPIVVGAILYGEASGAFLGLVFAIVVLIATVTGADAGAYLMFQYAPVWCVALIIVKSTLAGYLGSIVYKAFHERNEMLGVVLASIVVPCVNTGLFCLACATIFNGLIGQWAIDAGFQSTLGYIIIGLAGINFLVEMLINVLLVPVISRVIKAVR